MFDVEIEDNELEGLLEERLQLAAAAARYRQAKKEARAIIEARHDDAVNVEGENGGWVRVGRHRFLAKRTRRAAGEVTIGEGWNFKLEIEAI